MGARYQAETPLLHNLLDVAGQYGWMRYHALPATIRQGRMLTPYLGDKGFPDLVLVHPRGGILFRELKAEGHYPDPDQRKWLERLESAIEVGTSVGWWRPRDQQDAVNLLGGIGLWR
jgi:VRR-NUC domain